MSAKSERRSPARSTSLLLAVALVAAASCTSARRQASAPGHSPAPEGEAGLEQERATLRRAFERMQDKDPAGARDQLRRALDSPAFGKLPPGEQHWALLAAGAAYLELGSLPDAHALLRRSSAMQEADKVDWHLRLQAAWRMKDVVDAIRALRAIAQLSPETLSDIRDSSVFYLVGEARKLPDENDRFELLQALHLAGWKPATLVEPSWMWRDLALLLLERGAPDRAKDVAARVDEPYTLISMRADGRFRRIVQADPARFDVGRALALQLRRSRAAAANAPESLETLLHLTRALLSAHEYREVLDLTNGAIERAASPTLPYRDTDRWLIWAMDHKARALRNLGRWNEAVEELSRASRLPEEGQPNVSHAINLGLLYCKLDRPKDALATVAGLGDASPYGRVQMETVRLLAALELGDAAGAARSLAYVRDHKDDAPDTVQDLLVQAGDIEEATRLMVSRLGDPKLRNAALFQVQRFTRLPGTPRELQWRAKWDEFVSRQDVQAAIAKVGVSESYEIAPEEG